MTEDEKEEKCISFLIAVYTNTPVATVSAWGMERYSRFKTRVWKHLEDSSNLKGLISGYFSMFPANIDAVLTAYDDVKRNEFEVFEYLKENLPICVGRMQRQLKITRVEKEVEMAAATDENGGVA